MASNVIRFGQHLKELRIHLCQKSATSKGVRDFIESHYVNVKKANPTFPILVRECSGVEPKMAARYDFGVEKTTTLSNLKAEEIMKTMEALAAKS
ncbi:NADH dehydrogenase [ubiquinone] 1 alpha subcomplex subunit 2-like [Lineus longissimus]|uniref:NADH dehydrogenase [ubiquinone] 1 alpha subcomplex subunit 2-like n=1 Tax=Lineus longissimus TaxID=88925 RepID=UPI002B4F47B0